MNPPGAVVIVDVMIEVASVETNRGGWVVRHDDVWVGKMMPNPNALSGTQKNHPREKDGWMDRGESLDSAARSRVSLDHLGASRPGALVRCRMILRPGRCFPLGALGRCWIRLEIRLRAKNLKELDLI